MNFVKRGLISVVRRKAKSIILLILIFILGNVIAGAISIEQAVKNTEENIRKQIGGVATIEIDYEQLPRDYDFDYNSIEYINKDTIMRIGELPYVRDFDYVSTFSLEAPEMERVTSEEDSMARMSIAQDFYNKMFSVRAVHYLDVLDFKEGNGKIIEGRTFREEDLKGDKNPIIITKELAELNNLSVGSIVTFQNNIRKVDLIISGEINDSDYELLHTASYEFEVIGIYEPKLNIESDSNGGIMIDYYNVEKQNQMYTTTEAQERIEKIALEKYEELSPEMAEMRSRQYYTPIFILNDPLELEDFKRDVEPMLPQYSVVVDSSSSFDSIAAPLKNIEWIASIVLYVALGATLVILSLLITLFLRDRKHEMGIYLSLGEKKTKVMGQIVIEVVLIAIIGITLSLFTGNIIASGISEQMLNNQMLSDQENEMYYGGTLQWLGYGEDVTAESIMESYKVSLGLQTVLMFYGIGILTVLVSTIVPNVYILRLNPKKIMM